MRPPPSAFHVMAKPTGAVCNLDCAYCFYREKAALYPDGRFRMSDSVLESYLRQTIEAHRTPQITIAWQGGEPTLMGLDFFRRAVGLERKYLRPGVTVERTLQTNGILLNDEWCEFFREHAFLVGLSLDGTREMHDAYRRDHQGNGTFDRVVQAARLMQEHGVEFNVLATVHTANGDHPLELYRFFRDELKAQYLQLIAIVEPSGRTAPVVTDRSVRPEQFGRFLIGIFDEWVRRDVGRMFVQLFDGVLASYVRGYSTLCTLQPACGEGVALEHNGDLYSCDHFVNPEHRLGNIVETPLRELIGSDRQQAFGRAKSDTLPRYCRECEFLFTCHGECPKNRLLSTPDGEPGLNYLCAGLKAFLRHSERPMRAMAGLLQRGREAAEVMPLLAAEEARVLAEGARGGRNAPCPCGSGRKFKRCHGARPLP
jgi:serine-type anaerobic sulfatase-maturating enzyme